MSEELNTKTRQSEAFYQKALTLLPGGVNSPVRAFGAVGGTPLFIDRGEGAYLFDAQHYFPGAELRSRETWTYHHAALKATSMFDMSPIMHWFTGNIGYHHVHHLNARIPNYRLQACMEANPEFQEVTRITIRESWRLTRLALWDEEARELISFREVRRRLRRAA